MASLTLTTKSPASLAVDALVVGVASVAGTRSAAHVVGDVPDALRTRLDAVLPGLGVTGAAGVVHRLPGGDQTKAPVVVLVGLGRLPASGPDHEVLRRAAGAATRELTGTASVALALPADDEGRLAAVAEGALLGAYAFTRYRSSSSEKHLPVQHVTVATPLSGRRTTPIARHAEVLAEAVALTRDLVNTAPADLSPAALADVARASSDGFGVTVTVLDERDLEKRGFGGILGVGKGSSRPPRLVRLSWSPRGARSHVALVGKGITFDSGGLSIKPAAAMETMKLDMAGAAAVLATVVAAARLGVKVRVTGWLPLAENMPSGSAQRPSDVLTTYGGTTVEVKNTDAEGRLVLADAIVAAGEEKPDAIVDVATLTGAQLVALGARVSGVMGSDDALRDRVVSCAGRAGEAMWAMPLPEELRPSLDSTVADLANTGERNGGMLVAGLFLREFVPTREGKPASDGDQRVPWAHIDIAGPSFNEKAGWGYTPKGGTGIAVRTLLALLEDVAASGI